MTSGTSPWQNLWDWFPHPKLLILGYKCLFGSKDEFFARSSYESYFFNKLGSFWTFPYITIFSYLTYFSSYWPLKFVSESAFWAQNRLTNQLSGLAELTVALYNGRKIMIIGHVNLEILQETYKKNVEKKAHPLPS